MESSVATESIKYLSFFLQGQSYGVNVENIVQIIAIPEITPIPHTPFYIKGVFNRSGKITPVMDLRLRLGLPERAYDDRTSIIVIKIPLQNQELIMGMIVDNVLEVIDIHDEFIDKLPVMSSSIDNDYIEGMAKLKDKVVTLLDSGKILSRKELNEMHDLQSNRDQ